MLQIIITIFTLSTMTTPLQVVVNNMLTNSWTRFLGKLSISTKKFFIKVEPSISSSLLRSSKKGLVVPHWPVVRWVVKVVKVVKVVQIFSRWSKVFTGAATLKPLTLWVGGTTITHFQRSTWWEWWWCWWYDHGPFLEIFSVGLIPTSSSLT